MNNNAFKFNKDDEFYTPKKWVQYIIDYLESVNVLKQGMTIWCPFDLDISNFVKILKDRNYNVINSHIDYNQDFFTYTPSQDYDLILSNPPFSGKTKTLIRLKELNKPFALIFGNQFFQTGSFLREINTLNNFQIIAFEKRMYFVKNYELDLEIKPKGLKQPAFASVLLCNDLHLEKDFIVLKGV